MFARKLPIALASLAAGLAAAGLTAPCQAQLCGCAARPAFAAPVAPITSYRPAFFAAAPVATQTVNYVPYTAYRTVYANMPVTTYQPMAACGPCGSATTVMRPVTTYALRPQLVPYTTYRPVVTPIIAAYAPVVPGCAPCGAAIGVPLVTSQMATTMASPYAAAPVGPSCVGCAAPPTATYATPGVGMPAGMAPGYAAPGAPGSTVPSLGLPNINAPPTLNGAPVPQGNTSYLPSTGSPGGNVIMGPPSANYGTSPVPPVTYSAPGSSSAGAPSTNGSSTNGSSTNGSAGNGSSTNGSAGNSGDSSSGPAPESRLRPRVIPDIAPPPSGFSPGAPTGNGPDGVGNPAGSPDDAQPKMKDTSVEGQKTNLQQPKLTEPDDRLVARPLKYTTAYRPEPASPAAIADDGGWRAARATEN